MKKLFLALPLLLCLTTIGLSGMSANCFQTTIAVSPAAITLGDSATTTATFTNCGTPSDVKRVLTQITATNGCYTLPVYDIYLGETTLNAGRSITVNASFTPPCPGTWTVSADIWTRNNINLAHSETTLNVN